jgi:Zyg-11 family protein
MTSRYTDKRPNCEEILEDKDLWALDENDFDLENALGTSIESELKGKNFLIHHILESKLIAIKTRVNQKSKESSAIETLNLFKNKPDFIQKFLVQLKDFKPTNSEIRTNYIDSIVLLMRKYPNSADIQLNTIECLYSIVESHSRKRMNQKLIEKVVKVTLTAMELYPNHQRLQKSALIILYSDEVLKNLLSKTYDCTKLVMDSLVNFKKTDTSMNLMASVICSTNLMELSDDERSNLGSNVVYIETFLDIINSKADSSLYYDVIENTLSALVNLLVDSSNNCLIFLKQGGLDISFSLLKVMLLKTNEKIITQIF